MAHIHHSSCLATLPSWLINVLLLFINLLTPNVNYSGRTTPLTSKVLIRRKCSESLYRHLEDIFSKHSYKKLYNNLDTVGSTKIAVIWEVVCSETSSRIYQNFGVYEIAWHHIQESVWLLTTRVTLLVVVAVTHDESDITFGFMIFNLFHWNFEHWSGINHHPLYSTSSVQWNLYYE